MTYVKTVWSTGDTITASLANHWETQYDEAIAEAQVRVTTHANVTNAHSATPAATANRIMIRDAQGRAKVAAPSASDDIARKDTVDAILHPTAGHKHTGAPGDGPRIDADTVDGKHATDFIPATTMFTVGDGETVNAGDVVEVCGDGSTVRKVKTFTENTFASAITATGSPVAGATQEELVQLTDRKYLHCYQTSSGVHARVMTVGAEGSVSFGPATQYASPGYLDRCFKVTESVALLGYQVPFGGDWTVYAIAARIEGNAIAALGAPLSVCYSKSVSCVAMNDNLVILAENASYQNYASVSAHSVTIDGNLVLTKTKTVSLSGYSADGQIVRLSPTLALQVSRHRSDNTLYGTTLSLSGTTLNSPVISTLLSKARPIHLAALNASRAFFFYEVDGNIEWAGFINVSSPSVAPSMGNTTSYGKSIESSWYNAFGHFLDANTVVVFKAQNNKEFWNFTMIDVSRASPTVLVEWGSIVMVSPSTMLYDSHSACFKVGNDLFFRVKNYDQTTDYYGKLVYVDTPKIIGVATVAAQSGQPTAIAALGKASGLTELMPGKKYYSTPNGDLTTTRTPFEVGVAVSETDLLLTMRPVIS